MFTLLYIFWKVVELPGEQNDIKVFKYLGIIGGIILMILLSKTK